MLDTIAEILKVPPKKLQEQWDAGAEPGGRWLVFGKGSWAPAIPGDKRLAELQNQIPGVAYYWLEKRKLGIYIPTGTTTVGDVGLPFGDGFTEVGLLGIHLTRRGAQAARDRKDDRREDRQDRREQRQTSRQERRDARQDDSRRSRRHDRQMARQERRTQRMSRRQDRKDERMGRRQDRQDYRASERQGRVWARQEARGRLGPGQDGGIAMDDYGAYDDGGGFSNSDYEVIDYAPGYGPGYADSGYSDSGYSDSYTPPAMGYQPDAFEPGGSVEFYDEADAYEDPWDEVDYLNSLGDGYYFIAADGGIYVED